MLYYSPQTPFPSWSVEGGSGGETIHSIGSVDMACKGKGIAKLDHYYMTSLYTLENNSV